jgi:hypothetical protein
LVSIDTPEAVANVRYHIRNTKNGKGKKFWVGKAGNWSWKLRAGKITYL